MTTEFKRWVENRHQAVEEWKERNRKGVFGYFCCVTPEELIYAAGVLPVRITGSSDKLEVVEDHVPMYGCGFVRSCLDLAGRGVYHYLDSVVVPNTCDLVARMEYWWRAVDRRSSPILAGLESRPYLVYIPYPEKVSSKGAARYLLMHFRVLKQHLERFTDTEITDEMLSQAIEVYNEHYRLMEQLDELRKQDPPLVSGYEAWEAEFASLLMPKDEHNRLMKAYLQELSQGRPAANKGVRLYLSASALDQETAKLLGIIEESGGQVVCEDISVHSSHYNGVALDATKPPMQAIVERCLAVPCPRSTVEATQVSPWPEFRWNYVRRTVDGYNIQGAIFYNLGYCECRALENPHLRDKLREEFGIPVLFLEGDYTPQGLEETRSRIEAFIEMVGG